MIAILLFLVSIVLLAAQYVTTGLFLSRLYKRPAQPTTIGQPRISLVRPVCGLDQFDAETLASSFAQNYPDYEIIFCAPTEGDAAVPVVRGLIAQNPGVRAKLLIGLDHITGNPKLNNIWKGWHAADADWICLSDSNLLLPPDYLSQLVAAWTPQTGLVSSPPTGIRPKGFGGHLECAFLNSNQARLQFASDSVGHGYAQGKTLFWNRAILENAGGVQALGRHLAEDVTSTKIVRGLGKRVQLTRLPFAQPIGQRSIAQVWDRQMRWSRVRRDGFPLIFGVEFINGAVFATVLFAMAAGLIGLAPFWTLAFLILWYVPEIVLMRLAGWPFGGMAIAALPLRDLMMPAIWVGTFAKRGIAWRGTTMAVPE